MAKVLFRYITGIKRKLFTRVILTGSWNEKGFYDEHWSEQEMEEFTHTDGCIAYRKEITFHEDAINRQFNWGIYIDSNQYQHTWAISEEKKAVDTTRRYKSFKLDATDQVEEYYLTHNRRLGANKYLARPDNKPGLRFSVWAPHAQKVEVFFTGAHPGKALIPMQNKGEGIWAVDQTSEPVLADFEACIGMSYLFRITREDNTVAERCDLYARSAPVSDNGHAAVIVDPDSACNGDDPGQRKAPVAMSELIIYALRLEALGFGSDRPGNLDDALRLLPHLKELGITAIELLPYNRQESAASFFRVDPEKFKAFITECHKWEIRVLLTLVCSHLPIQPGSSFWKYDSVQDEDNIWFWYEGKASDYPFDADQSGHHGGYIDNNTTGYAPRYHEAMVRHYFTGCAAILMEEFKVDGFRYQQVSSIHNNNKLNCNKSHIVNSVNIFGAKFLREMNRNLKLIDKNVILIAEDNSQWDRITRPIDFNSQDDDGLGFDGVWQSNYYYNMTGDTTANQYSYARLLYEAGFGENWPLKLDIFAYQGLLQAKPYTVIYHESPSETADDDEIGASRIIEVASHFRLSGEYVSCAEARCKFAAGMTLLSAGIPMLFMFEEVRARRKYQSHNILANREDYLELKNSDGKFLSNFYQHLIHLRKEHSGLRSGNIKILHIHNTNRVLAFTRWDAGESLLVIASLNNNPFEQGYEISHYEIDGVYREIFNSDYSQFGGKNIGNYGIDLPAGNNSISPVLPANGFAVFLKKELPADA